MITKIKLGSRIIFKIISTGLCQAALQRERKVCYIKPVQTGEPDEYFIQFYANPNGISDITLKTLNRWSNPISPHLAAVMEQNEKPLVSDRELVANLRYEIEKFSNDGLLAKKETMIIIETAGGVLSPGPSKTLQADIYRSLRLPIILVGDAKLGGITSTISAFESLRLRGYSVYAIAIIERSESSRLGNAEMIQEYLKNSFESLVTKTYSRENSTFSYEDEANHSFNAHIPRVFSFSPLPMKKGLGGGQLLHAWYKANSPEFLNMYDHFRKCVLTDGSSIEQMRIDGQNVIWWPFTQVQCTSLVLS